jgi:hypothetical protein
MKKLTVGAFALIGACSLCCLPLLFPALAGAAAFGLQLFGKPISLDAILCSVAPALIVGAVIFLLLRAVLSFKSKRACGNAACNASGRCGCK